MSARHIERFDNRNTMVSGQYRVILDYSRNPPVRTNRVEILLKDGFGIILEIKEKGLRNQNEQKKFAMQNVKISGILHHHCQINTTGYFASFQMSCLQEIKSIKLIK